MPIVGSLAGASIRGFGAFSVATETDTSAFQLIATYTVPSTSSTITFSSIPQSFKHLHVRGVLRDSTNKETVVSVGTSSYRTHFFKTDGTTISVGNATTYFLKANSSADTSLHFAPFIMDIFDYTSTTRNKTLWSNYGYQSAYNAGELSYATMLSKSNSAVTTLTLTASGAYQAHSTVSLYGSM